MGAETRDGTSTGTSTGTGARVEPGLRERKKQLMRRQLSDTATAMFVERGFDAVRVSEVAEACGVSEKTVFNYFPAKEALVMDRLEGTLSALRTGLADPARSPVEAMLAILDGELRAVTGWLADRPDAAEARRALRRFGELIRATPALRAYQADVLDRSASVVTQALATRFGVAADDPEPQIAARALLGLWHVHAESLRRHLADGGIGVRAGALDGADPETTPERLRALVAGDVARAARLLENGLGEFAAGVTRPR